MLVKYFVALITNELHLRDEVLKPLSARLGAPDFISDWFDFTHTNYYEAELGRDLKRSFVSFSNLLPPEELAEVKKFTIEVENTFRRGGAAPPCLGGRSPAIRRGSGPLEPNGVGIKNDSTSARERERTSGRRINIDPGYIDHFKIVLASHKFAGHRIAIGKGYWADLTMMYIKGKWTPAPWCYPDFRSGAYDGVLMEMRRLFKNFKCQSPNDK